ncbi:MAG: hypothetical protein ACTTHG_08020 [Treponemataceae bacterium]
MNIYVVFKSSSGDYELERLDFFEWETMKPNINKNFLIYESLDLEDREIKKYNFTQIIWARFNGKKIFVNLNKDEKWMQFCCERQIELLKQSNNTEENNSLQGELNF